MLVVLGYDLSVARISSQVDRKCDELFANDILWAVNDELVDKRDALGVGEGRFEFVLLAQVVQQLEDQSTVAWRFKDLDELWNQAVFIDLVTTFLVEGDVKEQP